MSSGNGSEATGRAWTIVSIALLVALPFVIYANNYRHDYLLDDAYTVLSNPSVRTLHNVPRYFADPATYTSIREQADYRPVLQVSYALDYRLGGYDTWWWHFTQILLHVVVTLGIFAVGRRVLELNGDRRPLVIAFATAAIFAVHPAASGVVNYFNARSSLLTAAFLLPSLVMYMRPIDTRAYDRPQWGSAALYTLALFTKVEAIGALGAFWAFDLWQRSAEAPERTLLQAIRATLDRRTLRRLAPALAITVIYLVIRWRVMSPFPFEETRHAADVGPREYFLTQLTAWWYYVYRWISPIRLVADYLAYPVFRSIADPVVVLSLAGWIAVGAMLVWQRKRAPYLLFLAIASLALLSPTSSIAPLAEMVNEHRPYLPIGIAFLAVAIPAGVRIRDARPPVRAPLVFALGLVLVALAGLTRERNVVFSTARLYWSDVLAKAPSSRAHLNYGLALMRDREYPGALRELQRARELAPTWYFTHLNLGVLYQQLAQRDSARASFDRAVAYDRYSGFALTWRGEFRLAQGAYGAARDDFLRSLPLALHSYRNAKGLATAYAALGDSTQSRAMIREMFALDSASATADVAQISAGDQQAKMAVGLDYLYRRNDPGRAAEQFRAVLRANPSHYGATYQLATALDRAGQRDAARPLWRRVLEMATGYNDQRTADAARARLK